MDFDNPPTDPLTELQRWLDEAAAAQLENPGAMTLATIDPDGRPSGRTVLLKGLDERGAVFYTNRTSRKGRALAATPRASLVFYWRALGRQVTIEGRVSLVTDKESDRYFASRPRGTQIAAQASVQSEAAESRADLEARYAEVQRQFEGRDIPRPPHWGGYRVSLERIEFWMSREDRLHDRVAYTRTADGSWRAQRLQP